jgi:vacuolar iron transporter family protein
MLVHVLAARLLPRDGRGARRGADLDARRRVSTHAGEATPGERRARDPAIKLSGCSFGSTSAIVTSVGLIVGFGAATASRPALVSSLLIVALADNVTDSLSIHVYQESEHLEGRSAFRATLTNFISRVVVAASFVALVIGVPASFLPAVSMAWGTLLLGSLTWALARARHVSPLGEILKHLLVAVVVVLLSRTIGQLIRAYVQ